MNITKEELEKRDEDAALGCAIVGFIMVLVIIGSTIL